jgi:glyceraldehyde-3-phosphate dehydrogenase/erythrose-4-phosphate dehydrogenase
MSNVNTRRNQRLWAFRPQLPSPAHERRADLEIVAINDVADETTLASLLKFDSVYRRFPGSVRVDQNGVLLEGRPIQVLSERDPGSWPWAELGVEVVIEATGKFRYSAGFDAQLIGVID